MSDPIRVLHFADVHIGMENYGRTDPDTGLSSRVVDFIRRLDELVQYATNNDVDLVIFAGDAFKTSNPTPTFQREFAWRVQDLAQLAPTVLLVGNHDLTPNALKATSIDIYETLRVPNVWVADQYEVRVLETKRGPVVVGTAPYPVRSRLMQNLNTRGKTIKETDTMLESELTGILEGMAEEADMIADDSTPRLLAGHFTVRGAVVGSERNVMLGRDVQVSLALLADRRWDYVALGHIHKHQNLTSQHDDVPPVVYSGSIERIDFGEESDPKGFCWVELQRQQTQWQYVELAARPMVTLRIDCRNIARPTQSIINHIKKHNLKQAIVRLIVQLTPETDAVVNDNAIRDALREAGVFHIAGLQRQIERPERSRLGGNPEGMTHEQLLEQYFISKDVPAERRAILMQRANDIMHGE